VILGAGYMLWMFQRVMFGPVTLVENTRLSDLKWNEGLAFLPLVIFIVWFGFYPQLLLWRINPTVESYLGMNAKAAATVVAPAQPELAGRLRLTEELR
jgi:NADH-quinone oxidoreductase subunit M